MKHFIAIVSVALGWTLSASLPSSAADGVAPSSEAWRVGTMGRQRMLAQRLVKMACLARVGADDAAQNYAQQFDSVLSSYAADLSLLRDGDPNLDLRAETNPRLLQSINSVSTEWDLLRKLAMDATLNSELNPRDLSDFDDQSLVVLRAADSATQDLSRVYGSLTLHPQMAKTINIAGRQRMLTQKMTKELCLAAKRHSTAINLHRFEGSVTMFDSTLVTLLNGSFRLRLPEAPTSEIRDALLDLENTWKSNRALASTIISRGEVSVFELFQFAARSDKILAQAHSIVLMYEAL